MSLKRFAANSMHCLRIGLTSLALFQFSLGGPLASTAQAQTDNDNKTTSPIKHVIVIIGENRSYDHVFATYVPKAGQTTMNLLSEGIIKADGTPGPNFEKAHQRAAVDLGEKRGGDPFLLSPPKLDFGGDVLPAPLVGGAKDSYIPNDSISLAEASENGLPANYYQFLVSGGTGLTSKTPDTRITNVNDLPAGPFQLTNGKLFDYNAYAASPVHRFYQMWQQLDCSREHITEENGSGCNSKLFSWVEVTVGAGTNGLAQPANFDTNYLPGATTTGEGSTALGFYNVQQGDVPYFKSLADTYAMSDNFHQSVQGGTGANHIMFGHGDAIWFSDGNGHAKEPPHNVTVDPGTPNAGKVDEVENPNPAAGTNNWYSEDGYGGGSFGSASYGGGSYSNCADPTQNGVSSVVKYLQSLPHPVDPHCEVGHYYLLNNYNPGYFGQGENAFTDESPDNTVFTIPPSSTPSIGDTLIKHDISWKYYGDQWNDYAGVGSPNQPLCNPPALVKNCYIPEDKYQINYGAAGSANPLGQTITNADEYCNICNPFQYDTSIMANAKVREAHIQDTLNLYADIANNSLPAVSIVKPSGFVDGHPSSSKLDLFEGFVQKIVEAVQANPKLWAETAIFITEDEGGGYYDSGYVQPLDFFGDGTRIIFLAVSPFSKGGKIAHNYSDHVSILKFIERNWSLPPVTFRSRDNFPNPITEGKNVYVPVNGPAISDLFELFDFK
ncbi:MAG: alkaline phosphatase family protein [Candidatus Acidiferrales bacterium]|jgi:phospholipase C